MIISKELWRKYKNLKQELLDLKQIKRANCVSKYYTYTYTSDLDYYSWQITYKSGSQPIIAEVLAYSDTALSAPNGNTQYLFSYSQAEREITILSTREIDNVVGIS